MHALAQNDRYYLVQDKNGSSLEIDRTTGRIWQIIAGQKNEIKSTEITTRFDDSLASQVIATTSSDSSGKMWIDVYNGSKWTVSEIEIRMVDRGTENLFREAVNIQPLTKTCVIFNIGQHKDDLYREGKRRFTVEKVSGYTSEK
jgi:hypothetical protein